MTTAYRRQFDIASFTTPGKKPYKVSERADSAWECSCPAWTRHTPRRECKHILKVKGALATLPAKKPTPASPVRRETQTVPEVVFEGYTIRQRRTLDSDVEAMQAVEGRRRPRTL